MDTSITTRIRRTDHSLRPRANTTGRTGVAEPRHRVRRRLVAAHHSYDPGRRPRECPQWCHSLAARLDPRVAGHRHRRLGRSASGSNSSATVRPRRPRRPATAGDRGARRHRHKCRCGSCEPGACGDVPRRTPPSSRRHGHADTHDTRGGARAGLQSRDHVSGGHRTRGAHVVGRRHNRSPLGLARCRRGAWSGWRSPERCSLPSRCDRGWARSTPRRSPPSARARSAPRSRPSPCRPSTSP